MQLGLEVDMLTCLSLDVVAVPTLSGPPDTEPVDRPSA